MPVGLVFPREYNFFENKTMVIQGASFFEKLNYVRASETSKFVSLFSSKER